jgi:hypothetical protein
VEQLQDIDPRIMTNDEKLAFWINVYNALLMHAYLAYGVPRSDLKFFNLMQKVCTQFQVSTTVDFDLQSGISLCVGVCVYVH